jgi:FkbM family methyltransferase
MKGDLMNGVDVRGYLTKENFPRRLRLLRWLGRQSWIPRGHDKLLRLVHSPERASDFHFEIDFFGMRYRGSLAEYVDWLVFCYGAAPTTEVFLLRDICSFLRRMGVGSIAFCDIGANVGHHTLFMSRLVEAIYAFEPSSPLVARIEEKIELNKLKNVNVVPVALGEEDQSNVQYFPGLDANPGAGSLIADFPGVKKSTVAVELRKGDTLCDKIGIPKINIMKVDVQGFEPKVFRGLAKRISTDRPVIITELCEHSRSSCDNEAHFRKLFYDKAVLAEIAGRNGRMYRLKPFDFRRSEEVLIVPPELAKFVSERS